MNEKKFSLGDVLFTVSDNRIVKVMVTEIVETKTSVLEGDVSGKYRVKMKTEFTFYFKPEGHEHLSGRRMVDSSWYFAAKKDLIKKMSE